MIRLAAIAFLLVLLYRRRPEPETDPYEAAIEAWERMLTWERP